MILPFLLASLPALASEASALRATCPSSSGPAVLVDISGFRSREGQVRVRVFGGPTNSYFDKKQALTRIEVPVPSAGRVSFCVAVPHPGLYAVDVRHDTNLNGKTDRSDGGGASGNPRVGLFDMLLGHKPDPSKVQVRVGNGVTPVPITLMYLQGGGFRPWR